MSKQHPGQLNLGQLIDLMETLSSHNHLVFDFESVEPTVLRSYRGYYEDICVGFARRPSVGIRVSDFLSDLEAAVGEIFYGYKGGEFVMTRDSNVWVANYGEISQNGLFITGAERPSWDKTLIVITTQFATS